MQRGTHLVENEPVRPACILRVLALKGHAKGPLRANQISQARKRRRIRSISAGGGAASGARARVWPPQLICKLLEERAGRCARGATACASAHASARASAYTSAAHASTHAFAAAVVGRRSTCNGASRPAPLIACGRGRAPLLRGPGRLSTVEGEAALLTTAGVGGRPE